MTDREIYLLGMRDIRLVPREHLPRFKELDQMGAVKRIPLISPSNPANANPSGRIKPIEPGMKHGGKVCRGRKAAGSAETQAR
jgi:hypothetical protein